MTTDNIDSHINGKKKMRKRTCNKQIKKKSNDF